MALRRLGFYQELEYSSPDCPSIREKRPLPPDQKERVIHYLESAPVLAAAPSAALDYFTGEVIAEQTFQTDGEWVWYGELPYYVRRYDTILDPDFLVTVDTRREATLSEEELLDVENFLFQMGEDGLA